MTSSKAQRTAVRCAAFATAFVLVGSTFGLLPWPVSLAVHFQPQGIVISGALLVLALCCRLWITAASMTLLGLCQAVTLFPILRRDTLGPERDAPTLSVLVANLWPQNPDLASVRRLVEDANADIAILQDLNEAQSSVIGEIPGYRVLEHITGFVLLRTPGPVEFLRFTEGLPDGLRPVELKWENHPLVILPLHPPAPLTRGREAQNILLLTQAAEWAQSSTIPSVIAGDLNTSQWSPAFRRLLERGALLDSQVHQGYHPTWPYYPDYPWAAPLRTVIDHLLHTHHLQTHSRVRLDYPPSNHRPILIQLSVKRAPHLGEKGFMR